MVMSGPIDCEEGEGEALGLWGWLLAVFGPFVERQLLFHRDDN